MNRAGLVVARHRRHVTVEDQRGERFRCLTRGRSIKPLAGDEVEWHVEDDGTAVVDTLMPRRSTLVRIDAAGRPEAVAANLTQLIVVAAPAPTPDWFLVDRYLVAAELMRTAAAIVWNKLDLGAAATGHEASGEEVLQAYQSIGYRVFAASVRTRAGIDGLEAAMIGQRSVLVGQSGVGKSSLINALVGEQVQAVGDLGGKRGHGRHTTTTAVLYRLAHGGELIDSPGVRHYAPHIDDDTRLDRGFTEFQPFIGRCRFADCRHLAEPACAVKDAVEDGTLSVRRYENYTRLLDTLDSMRCRSGAN